MTARALTFLPLLVSLTAASPALAARQVVKPLPDFVAAMRVFMPGEASGGFVVPTPGEQEAFRAAAQALRGGDIATAERALAVFHGVFEVLDFTDGLGGPRYLAIAEIPGGATGLLPRGWGFFFFARRPEREQLVIEAPHPLADRDSETDAAVAVSSLRPAAFLLAGAHRYADPRPVSDVAHTSGSVFEPVHEAALEGGRIAAQIHGFSLATHPGYPELLLSAGSTTPTADVLAICDSVNRAGVLCFPFDGSAYNDLGALNNVQGSYAAGAFGPGHFLHFETADATRADPARFGAIVNAIGDRFPAPGGCSCGSSGGAAAVLPGLLLLLVRRARFHPKRRSEP
jgi:MYXO-CTERM domain-containing protein